jgi:hypothetical protein
VPSGMSCSGAGDISEGVGRFVDEVVGLFEVNVSRWMEGRFGGFDQFEEED